jgi:hypothetical protein
VQAELGELDLLLRVELNGLVLLVKEEVGHLNFVLNALNLAVASS